MASQTNTPFINTDAITSPDISSSIEPQSPFHAMEEQDEGQGIAMVPVGPTISQYDDFDEKANDLKVYHGHADFDSEIQVAQISSSRWYFGKTKRASIKVLYMSVFAILGALLRIIIAQLFGEECKNPGTVGWLAAGQPLCVTANGETQVEGGIIFSDLPANLLGSFLMGLMESTDTMSLPKNFPIAWLNENHTFQTFDIIHLAIRTGFCGSLTTFSSWNSEMILMIIGVDSDRGSLLFRGLLGYLIGVETALASFVLGKNLAKYFHSIFNPALDKEATETLKKKEFGVYINSQLSDYERRFLSEFDMGEYDIYVDPSAAEYLARWRNSTRENRRVGNHLLPVLTDIEYTALILDEEFEQELLVPAMMAHWDLEALKKWRQLKKELDISMKFIEPREFRFAPAFRWMLLIFGLLIAGILIINEDDNYSRTYRTMLYSALFGPAGAILRWKLSNWNGKWKRFSWFPLGTFSANFFGSIVSASMIGIEYRMNGSQNFWKLGTVRAIRIGFAGCLSTVSTFINEFSNFLHSPSPIYGYIYVLATLICSGTAAALCYFILTYNEEPGVYYQNGEGYGY